jgi:AraC family L-rhamnose operon regulatory protein RhaS
MQREQIISYGHIECQLMHPHRNAGMEIVLVEQGHLEWAVDNRPEVLTKGSVFFTLPWQAHGSLFLREPKNRIYYILFKLAESYATPSTSIRFPQRFGFTPKEEKMLSRLFCGTTRHVWSLSVTAQQMFADLIRLLDSPTPLNTSTSIALLRCLILEVALSIENQSNLLVKDSYTSTRVRQFLQQLNSRVDEAWTLEQMATECGVKRTQFAKVCQSVSGYPPYTYLSRLRFEKVCELLRETTLSITDITYACGYESTQYMAASFKKNARMTPSDYRKLSPQLEAILSAGWKNPESLTREEERKRRQLMHAVGHRSTP